MQPPGIINSRYGQDMAIMRTRLQWFLFIAVLLLFAFIPDFAPVWILTFLIFTGAIIIAMHGLNLVMGYAGQVSIGHVAFMAVGGFTSTILMVSLGWNFWPALLVAGLMAALVGTVFGAPSLRLKGWYLAIATLAAHFIIIFILNRLDIAGRGHGLVAPSPSMAGFELFEERYYYYMVLGIVVVMTFFAVNITRTRPGRAFVAIRDNDLAAHIMGINIFGYKLLAFALSAFFAGIAGSLSTHYIGMAHTQYFPLMDAIWYLGFLVVGGMGSTTGVFFGAFVYQILAELRVWMGPVLADAMPWLPVGGPPSIAFMLWAVIIVAFLVFEPRGISHRWQLFKAYYRLHPFTY